MNEKLEYKIGFGDIYSVARDAVDFAKTNIKRDGKKIEFFFTFNQLEIHGSSSSDPGDLVDKYWLLNRIRRLDAGYKD